MPLLCSNYTFKAVIMKQFKSSKAKLNQFVATALISSFLLTTACNSDKGGVPSKSTEEEELVATTLSNSFSLTTVSNNSNGGGVHSKSTSSNYEAVIVLVATAKAFLEAKTARDVAIDVAKKIEELFSEVEETLEAAKKEKTAVEADYETYEIAKKVTEEINHEAYVVAKDITKKAKADLKAVVEA